MYRITKINGNVKSTEDHIDWKDIFIYVGIYALFVLVSIPIVLFCIIIAPFHAIYAAYHQYKNGGISIGSSLVMARPVIYFNIWDDFYDDGFIPEGRCQETHGYIESDVPDQEVREIIALIYDYISQLEFMTGITVINAGSQIQFFHLTHLKLDHNLLPNLQASGLVYNGKAIHFYSES